MNLWYRKNILSIILFPLSLIYRAIISIRHFLYKTNFFKSDKINVPVIVVCNITVGGTGKTPLVIALVNELKKQGFQPGVILRGYRGKNKTWPVLVDKNSDPVLVGDEAVLIAKNTGVPVAVGPKRIDDARMIALHCNIIISDDGLQHYALQRDIEIAVIDATRKFGNGFCLPAGPLREPVSRLKYVDFIIANKALSPTPTPTPIHIPTFVMHFTLDSIVNIKDENKKLDFKELISKKVAVVAGIGNPGRFFDSLRSQHINFEKYIFPDHYLFQESGFSKITSDIILMTEKDAVKCRDFSDHRLWCVKGNAVVDPDFFVMLLSAVSKVTIK